jgi:DNA-directed RNA polymerase subunit RPC12/RpoP
LPKCGLCGAEVDELPTITEEGTCSICGAKLAVAEED